MIIMAIGNRKHSAVTMAPPTTSTSAVVDVVA